MEQAFSYSDGERTFNSDDGVFTWIGNKTIFTPLEPFEYDTEYTVTISTLASDISGNPMTSSYTWHFTTGRDDVSPNIVAQTPMGGNVSIYTLITISFDEPMNKTSVESAFIIVPYMNGSFTWVENTLIFTPELKFDYGTTYHVHIGIEAKDLAGNAMGFPYQFSFTTEPDIYPPEIIGHYPSGDEVDINIIITITFNETMQHSSVEESFSIVPYVEGNFSWMDNILMFTPLILINDTTYTVTINEGAEDLAGNALLSQYQFSFTTKKDPYPPQIMAVEPIGVDIPLDSVIRIRFSEAMNLSTLYSAFRIRPYVAGTLSWENDTLVFSPNAKLAKSTVYNVTILSSATDLAGNPMIENYTWQFETEAVKPAQATPFPWDVFFFWFFILIIAIILVLVYYEYIYKRRKREEEEGEIEEKREKKPQKKLEEEPKEEFEEEEKPVEEDEGKPEEKFEEEPEEKLEEELEGKEFEKKLEEEEELEEKMEEDPLEELEELLEEE